MNSQSQEEKPAADYADFTKDEFGCRHVRVRGAAKVMCHCMFGVLALTADQLMRFVRNPNKKGGHSAAFN